MAAMAAILIVCFELLEKKRAIDSKLGRKYQAQKKQLKPLRSEIQDGRHSRHVKRLF